MSATTILAMTVLAAAISVLQLPAATPGYSTLIAHRELGSIKAKQLKEKTIMSKALESLFAACEELEASDVHGMAGRKPFEAKGLRT